MPREASTGRALRRGLPVLGLLLAVVGGFGIVAATRPDPVPTAALVGAARPVDSAATDPLKVTAQNSPTLVANPRNPANLALVNRVDIAQLACELRVSFDGGSTWRRTVIPTDQTCFAPDAAFGADGTLYVAFTTVEARPPGTSNPGGLWVASSGDGGRILRPPVMVTGRLAFQARVAADPGRPGRLYLTWLQADAVSSFGFASIANPVLMARSDDGGATWGRPAPVSAPARERVVAPVPAVNDAGVVHVAYLDVGDDRLDYSGAHEGRGGEPYAGHWSLVVARSTDGGATWHESVADAALVPTRRFLQLFVATPSLAVDGDRVYVALADGRAGDADVWLWRSTDAGARWDAPVRVNDTRPGDGRTQELPALSVSPGGRLDIAYYDRRADPGDAMAAVSLQSSGDGGRTFSPRVQLSGPPFDSRLGLGSDRCLPELGSRLAVLSTRLGALAVWADTTYGSQDIQKQVMIQALVSVNGGDR